MDSTTVLFTYVQNITETKNLELQMSQVRDDT